MKKTLKTVLQFTLFLGTGLVILYLVYQKQNQAYTAECAQRGIAEADCSLLKKVLSDFATADFRWLLVVLLLFIISNVSRTIRWNLLLQQLGRRPRPINSFLSIILGYFANLGLPRVGEFVRAGTLARYEGIPVEKVMGTVVLDRMVDVLSILIVTALALFIEYDRIWAWVSTNVSLIDRLGGSGPTLFLLAGIGLTGLLALYLFRRPLLNSNFGARLRKVAIGFLEGLQTIAGLQKVGWFVFHSINIWLMYFLMTYICFWAFTPTADLPLTAGLTTFVFGGWGIVIPSPGGMGTYHFLAQTALGLYGIPGEDGFSWANISFFSIQLGCNVLLGLLALLLLPIINQKQPSE